MQDNKTRLPVVISNLFCNVLFKITYVQKAELVPVSITMTLLRIAVDLKPGYLTTITEIWRGTCKLWSLNNIMRPYTMLIRSAGCCEMFCRELFCRIECNSGLFCFMRHSGWAQSCIWCQNIYAKYYFISKTVNNLVLCLFFLGHTWTIQELLTVFGNP